MSYLYRDPHYKPFWLLVVMRECMTNQNGCHYSDDIFDLIFLYENCCNLIQIALKLVPDVSDNGLAPNRQQAIILTNDGTGYFKIYAWLGLNELNCPDAWTQSSLFNNACSHISIVKLIQLKYIYINKIESTIYCRNLLQCIKG